MTIVNDDDDNEHNQSKELDMNKFYYLQLHTFRPREVEEKTMVCTQLHRSWVIINREVIEIEGYDMSSTVTAFRRSSLWVI